MFFSSRLLCFTHCPDWSVRTRILHSRVFTAGLLILNSRLSVGTVVGWMVVNVNEANNGTFPRSAAGVRVRSEVSRISELQTDVVSGDHLLIHFSFSLFFCCLEKREPEGLWRWRELREVRLVARLFDRRLFGVADVVNDVWPERWLRLLFRDPRFWDYSTFLWR